MPQKNPDLLNYTIGFPSIVLQLLLFYRFMSNPQLWFESASIPLFVLSHYHWIYLEGAICQMSKIARLWYLHFEFCIVPLPWDLPRRCDFTKEQDCFVMVFAFLNFASSRYHGIYLEGAIFQGARSLCLWCLLCQVEHC